MTKHLLFRFQVRRASPKTCKSPTLQQTQMALAPLAVKSLHAMFSAQTLVLVAQRFMLVEPKLLPTA